ncbi:hypothetical protein EDC04DRAFT_3118055 [Pisolithus marmoratus]|nr:hypothetical protein EDC04DRAFT_3118055 [Pisolithus marmoratus]
MPNMLPPQRPPKDRTLNKPLPTTTMITVLPSVPLRPPGLPAKPARNVAAPTNPTVHQTVSPPPIQSSSSSSSSDSAIVKIPRAVPSLAARTKGNRGKHDRFVKKHQTMLQLQNNDTVHLDCSAFERYNFSVRNYTPSPGPTSIRVKVPLPPPPPLPSSSAKTSSLPRVQPHSALPPKPEQQVPPRHRQPETCIKWLMGRCDMSPCRYLHGGQPGSCLDWLTTGTCRKAVCPFQHAQPTTPCLAWLKGSCDKSPCPFLHEQRAAIDVDASKDACKGSSPFSHEKSPSSLDSSKTDPSPFPLEEERKASRPTDRLVEGRCDISPCRNLHGGQSGSSLELTTSICRKPVCPSQHAQPTTPCLDWLTGSCHRSPCPFFHVRRPAIDVDVSEGACKGSSPFSHEKSPSSVPSSKTDPSPFPLEKERKVSHPTDRLVDRSTLPCRPPLHDQRLPTCVHWIRGVCRRSPCPDLHSRQPETCAKWRQDICQRPYCPYVHDRNVICPDWLKGRCTKAICRHAHKRPPSGPSDIERNKQALSKPTPSLNDKQLASMKEKQTMTGNRTESQRPPEPLFSTMVADHIKVRLDRGFEVRDVVTGFESRWIHLGNVKPGVSSDAIRKLLSQYGQVDAPSVPDSTTRKSLTVRAQFSTPAEAMKAATALHGQEFYGQNLTAKVSINNFNKGNMVVTDTDVCVTWQAPHRTGYAGYATLTGARAVLDSVADTQIKDNIVTADLYDGLPAVGAYNVIFQYLPAETTEKDIRKLGGDVESIMLERANYTSIERALQTLHSILENHGTVISFDHLPPPYRGGLVKVWARFSSHAEAAHAQESLDGRSFAFLGRTSISVRHVLSMSYTLPFSVYRKLRDDLVWLRQSWWQRYGPGITLSEKGDINGMADGPVFIRVSCEDSLLLSHLKYQFEQLLRGDTVMFDKKPIWDDFLTSPAGLSFIQQLQTRYPGVEIQLRRQSRFVAVMGSITRRHLVKQEIVRKIVEVKSQQLWDIPLPGRALGLFLSEDLTRLQETFGPENCYLNYTKRALIVRGNEQAFRVACKSVQDVQSRQEAESSQSDAICPVCFNDPVLPTFLPCGHQWCRGCLTGYLVSAVDNKTFPLNCLGNDACCKERIPLSLARELLTAPEFDAVVEAAFWTHVHSRPDEFHHCPVPDCIQIYRSAPRNTILQCPSCLTHICPACHIEYHDGMTCEERDEAEDKLFWQWRSDNDVKDCPVCRVPIERSEGCNHMTCTRCQSHICWECLAVFPRGEGIYDHMRHKHGGIGL